MSFLDLEAQPKGEESKSTRSVYAVTQHREVVSLLTQLSTSVQGLRRKVSLLGTPRDGEALRMVIEDKDIPQCEELRERLQSNPKLTARDKYVSDFQWLNTEFLQLKREFQTRRMASPLRNRNHPDSVAVGQSNGPYSASTNTVAVDETNDNSYVSIQVRPDERTPLLFQQQAHVGGQDQVLQEELDFHTLIQDVRNEEITKIHTQVQDVNAIFKQLGMLVHEQGGQVDTIDQNINGLASNLQDANRQLRRADKYQRHRNKCGTFTLMIIAVVTMVVLLAVLS